MNQLKVGTVTELVNLSRAYDSLATQDGVVFYASYHNELWRIDLSAEPHNREQRVDDRVAPNHFAKLLGQEMVNGNLFAYEVHHGNLHLVDRQTGNVLGTHQGFTGTNFGTIVFCPAAADRHHQPVSYD